MKVLFTSPILEHPAAGGPQLRIENSVKALSAVCDLHLVSRAETPREDRLRTLEFFRAYCTEFRMLPRLEREFGGNRYLSKVRRVARRMLDSDAGEDAAFLLEHVDRNRIDLVWFGYGNISFPLMRR